MAEDLEALAAAMKGLGDKTIMPSLRKSMTAATKKARRSIRDRIRKDVGLPRRGGLNRWLGGTPGVVSELRPGRASIRLKLGKGKHDLKQLDAGIARHPVFGHRKRWANTSIHDGWWEKAVEPVGEQLLETTAREVAVAVDEARKKYGSVRIALGAAKGAGS